MGPDSPLKVWTYGANDKVRSCLCGFVRLTFESALSLKSVLTDMPWFSTEEQQKVVKGLGYICQDLSAVLNGLVQTASAKMRFSLGGGEGQTARESPIKAWMEILQGWLAVG